MANGHGLISGRRLITSTKQCSRCGEIKSIADFDAFSGTGHRDGLEAHCRPCGSVIVRTGQPQDMPAVMAMAYEVAKENGIVQMDEQKVVQEFWPALNLDEGIVGIIGGRDAAEGFILLRVARQWYSSDPTLEERVAFVREAYRSKNAGNARKLCEFAKRTAETLRLPLTIGILSNQRTEAKVKLYRRVFGEPAGAFWLVNGQTGRIGAANSDPLTD